MRNILSVYSGKVHRCMCGCSGKHTYNPEFREEGTKRRGYEVTAEDCNERTVKMIAKKVLGNPNTVFADDAAWLDTETRTYMVRFAG